MRMKVLPAGRLQTGDIILVDSHEATVRGKKRAAGRKPKDGENLVIMHTAGELRINSLTAVRMRR